MSDSNTIGLGPNGQEEVEYEVDENVDQILATIKSQDHDDVEIITNWDIDGQEFPDDTKEISKYPAKLEPLGDVLHLKFRNLSDKPTEVVYGLRDKKLVAS